MTRQNTANTVNASQTSVDASVSVSTSEHGKIPTRKYTGPQKGNIRECDVVRVIYEGLSYKGYIVLRVGQHRADKAGSDRGVPDLLVRRCDWPRGRFVGLEVKGKKTALSDTQAWLEAQGGIFIVRSFEDALKALEGQR